MKALARALIAAVVAVSLLVAASTGLVWFLAGPPGGPEGERSVFTIEKGESVGEIADRLENDGLLRSGLLLKIISRLRGTENAFQAGSYLLPADMNAWELHDYFITGRQHLIRLTIPEGWTVSKIARRFEESGISSAGDFLAAAGRGAPLTEYGLSAAGAEGFLFPDTYMFQAGYPADKIVAHMVKNFFVKTENLKPESSRLSRKDFYNRVTLASIIEREYRSVDEAPLMASVFLNRLKVRMNLGSCATVEYVMTEILGRPHPDLLTYKDLELESEYNTYIHPGLPPAPIGNPGLTALKAAFKPAESDFLYFVLRDPGAGRHFFSKSLAEHEQAKFFYLKRSGT